MEEHRRRMEERRELERRFDAGDIKFINRFFTPSVSTEDFLKCVAAGEKEFIELCFQLIEYYCNFSCGVGIPARLPH